MGGRGAKSGVSKGANNISFVPQKTTTVSEKLNGQMLSLSRGTITIKDEYGKTKGLVRADRVSEMAPRDKFTVDNIAKKNGVSLMEHGLENFYYDKSNKQIYYMNNTSGNYIYEKGGKALAGFDKFISKQNAMKDMENNGIIVVNHK